MIITIHQPEHLIWLGLIDKIFRADVFVVLDNVQFRKNYFQNRNKIKTKDGWAWLTVPVKKHPLKTKIKDIEISYNHNWVQGYLDLIRRNYKKTKYFTNYFPELEKIILKKYKYLADLNLELIKFILKHFKIETKVVRVSELKLSENKSGSDLILEICQKLSAETYLSGTSGKDYLNIYDFESAGIKVIFQEFDYSDETLSSIDLLFNYGPKSFNNHTDL